MTTTDEELLLGLLNSTPLVAGRERDDLTATTAWQQWLSTRGDLTEPEGRAPLTAVRAALQDVVRGDQPSSALTPFLRGIRSTPTLTPDGVEWTLTGPPRTLIPARAVLAWDAVQQARPGRLRPCGNDECQLFLLDRSKANTARWCSMQSCGNRMKARRHYESRTRQD
ncbi:CGNR zinc finger domain-containing protein [Kribbella sandramycini]|uniref:CGNR zinc finger domain-containing protein n=1 Tax=Kribbella sandramycini TaxID=60450 RepID=A0A7Y4KXD6_9ACTN|nr:CGNR zinc finger domain-containing protein [Kribbella sandramycini]MBB6569778.1 putative RNA-binding Zn ribbon-like protein [Kribbella sandramycini]NOL40395.1 CGNR zinc finger domain-containing protein [Kribbella sandramycini]